MKTEGIYVDYKDTGAFSKTLIDYLDQHPSLAEFISDWPTLDGFGRELDRRRQLKPFDKAKSQVLAEVLREQYASLFDENPSSLHTTAVRQHIDDLQHNEGNTYTITTGHQLNVFTGPLYFLFKIACAIRLARDLKTAYPQHHFIPVYWMATEDHDFAEINHTYVQGKKIAWEVDSPSATGRLSTATFAKTLNAYRQILGISEHASSLYALMEEAYTGQTTLADATRALVHRLFGTYGLVVLDADDRRLKAQFASIIEDDIVHQHSFQAVQQRSQDLERKGYGAQIHSREINFFYLTDAFRERIVQEGDRFQVLNQNLSFTQHELLREIDAHPERFSPNVVMRPLYQEVVLPNLAYIGGGAEIAYWLQLKSTFDHYQVAFPLLVPRNSAAIVDKHWISKLERLGLSVPDLFLPLPDLTNKFVLQASTRELSLQKEWTAIEELFSAISDKASAIDPTLIASTLAVQARLQKAYTNLEKKLIRAEKRNYQDGIQQLEKLKQVLFPNGVLQERKENMASFYLKKGPGLVDDLITHFKPLDYKFTILY